MSLIQLFFTSYIFKAHPIHPSYFRLIPAGHAPPAGIGAPRGEFRSPSLSRGLKKQGKFGVDAGAPVGGANLKIAPLPVSPPEGARRAPDAPKSPPPFSNGIHHALQRHDHINKFALHKPCRSSLLEIGCLITLLQLETVQPDGPPLVQHQRKIAAAFLVPGRNIYSR